MQIIGDVNLKCCADTGFLGVKIQINTIFNRHLNPGYSTPQRRFTECLVANQQSNVYRSASVLLTLQIIYNIQIRKETSSFFEDF